MNRTVHAALAALLALAACRIERTPPDLLTRDTPAEQERAQAVGELRARLALLGQALARGAPERAVEALAPAVRVQVVGPVGPPRTFAGTALSRVFARVLADGPGAVRLEETTLNLAPGADAAWFAGVLRPANADSTAPAVPWRVTGLLLLDEGGWRLVQLHVSGAPADSTATEQTEPNPEAPGDE